MASISEFGIACARPMAALAALTLSVAALAQTPATTDLTIEIGGLRDARGMVRICLTANPKSFPDCKGSDAVHATVKASLTPVRYQFKSLPADYAVGGFMTNATAISPDDGIPKEGFAFRVIRHATRAQTSTSVVQGNGPPLPR